MSLTIDGNANSITSSTAGVNIPATVDTLSVGPSGSYMIANSSGVGIGTLTPRTTLDVGGTIRNTPDKSSYIQVGRFSAAYGGAALSTAGGATFLSLQVEGFEGARIDSSGRMTIPNQPCFHASHSNNTLTTGEIVWGNLIFNTGSNYNTSNGRFTAPVSGNYFFRAHTLISNASSGEARIAIYKNGAGYGGLRFITIKPANQWWTLICEGHVSMTANEYVSVFMETNPGTLYSDSAYNSFTGHLIG